MQELEIKAKERVSKLDDKITDVLSKLPKESADLIRAVWRSRIFSHVTMDELKAISEIFGGYGSVCFVMVAAFEAGYIRGARTERRRKQKREAANKKGVQDGVNFIPNAMIGREAAQV